MHESLIVPLILRMMQWNFLRQWNICIYLSLIIPGLAHLYGYKKERQDIINFNLKHSFIEIQGFVLIQRQHY